MLDRRVRRRTFLKYAAAGAGALLSPALLGSRPTRVASAPETLDELLEPVRASHGVPALAGAFIQGQELVGLGAVGLRRMGATDRVQPTDRFHLGSCTKSMTATLIAALVEQAKLSWNTPLADAFPDLRARIRPDYHGITLVHLLSHRSGLPEDRRPDSGLVRELRALTGPVPQQRRALLELALARPPAAEPGSRMYYSNIGYTIAGAWAEQVTGRAWEELTRELLFAPLGLTTAGFGPPGPDQPWGHLPEDCQPIEPRPEADNPPVLGPAGRVHATLADWARYASLHLQGARGEPGLFLKPETFQQLHRDHYQQGYALGWAVLQRAWAGGVALAHNGTNGLWYAVIWLGPARNLGFLAATNCGGERAAQACDAAVTAIAQKYLS